MARRQAVGGVRPAVSTAAQQEEEAPQGTPWVERDGEERGPPHCHILVRQLLDDVGARVACAAFESVVGAQEAGVRVEALAAERLDSDHADDRVDNEEDAKGGRQRHQQASLEKQPVAAVPSHHDAARKQRQQQEKHGREHHQQPQARAEGGEVQALGSPIAARRS